MYQIQRTNKQDNKATCTMTNNQHKALANGWCPFCSDAEERRDKYRTTETKGIGNACFECRLRPLLRGFYEDYPNSGEHNCFGCLREMTGNQYYTFQEMRMVIAKQCQKI